MLQRLGGEMDFMHRNRLMMGGSESGKGLFARDAQSPSRTGVARETRHGGQAARYPDEELPVPSPRPFRATRTAEVATILSRCNFQCALEYSTH